MIYSKELEKQLLAALIQHPNSYAEIANLISEKDFYSGNNSFVHKTMFKIIKSIQEKGEGDAIDDVVLIERLKSSNITFIDNVDISDYVRSLTLKKVPSEAIISIAKELNTYTIRRSIDQNAEKIQSLVRKSGGKNSIEIIEEADAIYNSLINSYESSGGNLNPVDLYEGISEFLEDLCDNPVDPGFFGPHTPMLNDMYGPLLRPGNINIIGARPGIGKTTFTLDFCTKASHHYGNVPLLHFDNGEMSLNELRMRQAAALSGVPLNLIESGKWRDCSYNDPSSGREISSAETRRRVYDAVKGMEGRSFRYVNVGGLSVDQMLQIARSFYYSQVGRGNPMILSFDYIKAGNERSTGNKAGWEVVGEMVQKFKDFISNEITFNDDPMISMLTSVQTNRSAETRGRNSSNLVEDGTAISLSDHIVQFASNVFLLRNRTEDEESSEHPFYSSATHRLTNIKPRHLGKDPDRAKKDVLMPAIDENGDVVGNSSREKNCIFLKIDNFGVEELGDLRDMAERMRFDDMLPDQDGEL